FAISPWLFLSLNGFDTDTYISHFAQRIFAHILLDGEVVKPRIRKMDIFLDKLLVGIQAAGAAAQPTTIGFSKAQFKPFGGVGHTRPRLVYPYEDIRIPVVWRMA